MKKTSPRKPDKKTESLQVIPKTRVSSRCSICLHIAVKNINAAVRKGRSLRDTAGQFGVSKSSLARHTENCLKLDLQALLKEKRIEQAVEHYQELIKQLEFSKELQEAVRELLTDTKTDKITLAPRDYEIEVLYLDYADLDIATGLPKRKKEKLSDIIQSIATHKSGFNFQGFQVKTINYFDAAINSIEAVDKVLDKFAKVDGHYQKERESDETLNRVAKAFLTWLEDHQEVPESKRPLWLQRFAENSGVDLKRLADRVGIEIS
jgi:AraC-like DNA-binding protein